jgi:hypothetical protein
MKQIRVWTFPQDYWVAKKSEPSPKLVLEDAGYIELDEFDEYKCWDLCNWSNNCTSKPTNLYSDLDNVSSNVIFHNPWRDNYYLAVSRGWFVATNITTIVEFITDLGTSWPTIQPIQDPTNYSCDDCEHKLCYHNESCGYCNDCNNGNNHSHFCINGHKGELEQRGDQNENV